MIGMLNKISGRYGNWSNILHFESQPPSTEPCGLNRKFIIPYDIIQEQSDSSNIMLMENMEKIYKIWQNGNIYSNIKVIEMCANQINNTKNTIIDT